MPSSRIDAVKEHLYVWEGKDKHGKAMRGEMKASGESLVQAQLRRQGVFVTRVRRRRTLRGHGLKRQDLAVFTRQMATMIRAGVPLLQALEIIGRGQTSLALSRIIQQVRNDVATGNDLSTAMSQHPSFFSPLFCNLVAVGESAGVLDQTLDRLAVYEEKALTLRNQIRSALVYPTAVLAVAIAVVALILIVVVPTFKDVFASFGAELPLLTRMVVSLSESLVAWWWVILGVLVGGGLLARETVRRSESLQFAVDAAMLRLPVVGDLINRALVARWTRTLSTLFGAGIPLVDALSSVAASAGNRVFTQATMQVQRDVSTGQRMTLSMEGTGIFPPMVVQMASIGEESGSLDQMMGKTADFFEAEVDEKVKGLSSLLEPMIIVILGVLIGGIVVAMYLPIFQLGSIA
jgi:type IV pilus assembly protein PilC